MVTVDASLTADPVSFGTSPDRYRHWRLAVDGRIATLTLDVDEDGGLRPGYKLKLNSYDLGVDIELHDALQRIRFEHPGVACVVITSAKDRSFCAGANIYMLGTSSHRWKVNFCKFTNETRNGMEDSSLHDGLRFVAAVNGACAGGGYEIALACDEILMVDDRSTAVSLPEVPLLGVLPGTGGLTRLVDKRGVRRDLADVFCTNADGVRAERAKAWRLVDHIAPPSTFPALVRRRAEALAASSPRAAAGPGIALHPLAPAIDERGYRYRHLEVRFDRTARSATLTARPSAVGARRDRRRRRRMVAARVRARARRRAPHVAHERVRARRARPAQRGRTRRRPRARRRARRARRPLAGARDDRSAATHLRAARGHLAQHLRGDRPRLVLRRNALRARTRRRSQLHARA
jgi:benzoyl-CoA-dihydrodiol lyase